MTRQREDEFVARWKAHVAGTIALGNAKARVVLVGAFDGKSSAEKTLAELDETAETLLRKLFRDFSRQAVADAKREDSPATNGQARKQ